MERYVITCDVCRNEVEPHKPHSINIILKQHPEKEHRKYDICPMCAPKFWAFIMNGKVPIDCANSDIVDATRKSDSP